MPKPYNLQQLARMVDTGTATRRAAKEMFVSIMAAKDLVLYLRANCGTTADWPLDIVADNEEAAGGVARKLTSLEQLLPPNTPDEPQAKRSAPSGGCTNGTVTP